MTTKKERRQEIKAEMKHLREIIAFYRRQIDDLKEEQRYIAGNYDETWESHYAVSVNSDQEVKE
jgi:hypothetical protein